MLFVVSEFIVFESDLFLIIFSEEIVGSEHSVCFVFFDTEFSSCKIRGKSDESITFHPLGYEKFITFISML